MSPARFSYTIQERADLAREITLPTKAAARVQWVTKLRFADPDAAILKMPGIVARTLELCASTIVEALASGSRRPIAQDKELIARIGTTAAKLLRDLEIASISAPKMVHLFWLHDAGRFLRELAHIKTVAAEIEQVQEAVHSGDPFGAKHHNPELHEFVYDAVRTWETWSDRPAGTGRTGSPSTRFVCAACNPLIAFISKNNLGEIRRGNQPIDEAEAGRLIKIAQKSALYSSQV